MSRPESNKTDANFDLARREFAKLAVGGAALLSTPSAGSATMRPIPPGIKIGSSAGPATEENMLYLRQLGVTWVSYYDMSKVMKALFEVKFEGIVIPDHVPGLGSNPATEGPGRGGAGRGSGEFRPNPLWRTCSGA